MKKTRLFATLTAAALLLSLVACGTPAAPAAPDSGTQSERVGYPGTPGTEMVTLNITSEPVELNPLRIQDTISQSILYHSMSGLTRLDANDEPVADIAERWDISEDKTLYTMYLRKDAVWTNGDPVTAQDFYNSWVAQMRPETGAIMANYLYSNIKNGEAFYKGEVEESALGLRVVDDYTLEIEWAHPEMNGLFYLAQPFFLPINQKAYDEIGDAQYAKEADKMLTNGPYNITEWVHDSHLLLEKSDSYYGADSVKIPSVKLMIIGDVNTNLNAFTVGEIDLCSLYSEHIAQVQATDPNAVQSYIDGGSWFLSFNLQDEYLSNLNLRKALAYSIDVQSLLDYVINDGSVAAHGMVPDSIAGAQGESYAAARGDLFSFDKEAANGYLTQALQELGLDKSALQLTFWGTDTAYNRNQAAFLQQQWKENLGLEITLKSVPVKALTEARTNGEYSFAVDGRGPSKNDAITFLELFETGNKSNYGKYSDPAYDALIAGSMQEPDPLKRQDMLIEAEKLLIDNMVIAPMYFTCTTYGVSHKLDGLVRTPFQFFNVLYAEIRGAA